MGGLYNQGLETNPRKKTKGLIEEKMILDSILLTEEGTNAWELFYPINKDNIFTHRSFFFKGRKICLLNASHFRTELMAVVK